jgi:hypothetical protein
VRRSLLRGLADRRGRARGCPAGGLLLFLFLFLLRLVAAAAAVAVVAAVAGVVAVGAVVVVVVSSYMPSMKNIMSMTFESPGGLEVP